VLGYITLLDNMIRTTTIVAFERCVFFSQTLVFEFVLFVLVSFAFFEFTNILWVVVLTIYPFSLPFEL
jgi:hypothetical protein